jgi:hypothetical protein
MHMPGTCQAHACSPYEISPASGRASEVALTAYPDMKATSKPARAIRAAERASWHAGITMHRRSDRALDSSARSAAAGVVVIGDEGEAREWISRAVLACK